MSYRVHCLHAKRKASHTKIEKTNTVAMKYREIQTALKILRSKGQTLSCRLDSDFDTLEAELNKPNVAKVTSEPEMTSLDDTLDNIQECHSQETNITVLEIDKSSDNAVLGIYGEYRIIPIIWEHETNSAISQNREVATCGQDIQKTCHKIEIILDDDGQARAFPYPC